MPFQSIQPGNAVNPLAFKSKSDPLTQEDVDKMRARLQDMGLQDSWLGQANDWRGKMLGQRDDMSRQILQSVFGQSGGGAAGAAGAASGAAGGALNSAAGSAATSALGSSL